MSGQLKQVRRKVPKQQQRRQRLIGLLLILLWSAIAAWGFTLLTQLPAQTQLPPQVSPSGTVDVVPQRYQLAQQIYLEKCATCHIGVPPAVLPSETWRDILQDTEHYGKQITPLVDPERLLVWEYIKTFSRTKEPEEEQIPYRIAQSRYFRAIHPKVKLPQPVTMASCVTCHPKVDVFDFRTLSPEWENAP